MNLEFDNDLNEFLKLIIKNAQKQNIRVFFVGGFVRDYLLGIKTKDIDLIVEGNAIDFCKSIENQIEIKSIHQDFATVKVLYKDKIIDIASTRKEFYPFCGSLPTVESVGVEIGEDVKRRDFTINSLYLELKSINDSLEFELIDLIKGVNDIKSKTLRVLHDKSYIEDPTRILRGLDFKYRFGFDFSSKDKKLIADAIKNASFDNASKDRIKKVFLKVLSSKNAREIFKDIIKNKIYMILFKNMPEVDYDKINEIIKIFNLENKAQFYFDILKNDKIEKIQNNNILDIYNNFSKFNMEFLAYYYYKTNDKDIDKFLKIKDIKLNIKGRDLINLNYSKGKHIGEILDALLSEKLKKPLNFKTKDDEANWVLKTFPVL